MLRTYLHQLEQPNSTISSNEKYFGYYLPQTDTRYLRRHLNKNGGAYNGLIGCFEEHCSTYDAMIVLVKVSIQNPTDDTTIINEEEFHKMFTARESLTYINSNICSASELQKYKFEYFMIEYNLNVNYELHTQTIQQLVNEGPVSTETVAKLLLYSMGNSMQKSHMLDSTPSASSYRCSLLTDIEFTEKSYNNGEYCHFTLNECVITGLFNYLKNKNVTANAAASQAELFKSMICSDSFRNYSDGIFQDTIPPNEHYRNIIGDIAIKYESSTAYGNITHFANITWKDVIGSKLAQYMCPSYGKKSLSNKLIWFNESQRLTYITRIENLFEMINRPELFKLCISVSYLHVLHFTYSLYTSREIRETCFTPNDQSRIKFDNITNLLKIIGASNDVDNKFENKHHLDTDDKVNTKIIFNTNPYGIYNPKLSAIDEVSVPDGTTSSQLIDTQLNTVFPTMVTVMQSQIIPFSYQKRNIIWMNEIESKVLAGEHKMKIQSAKLTNYMSYHPNVYSYRLFDEDYYYIGGEPDADSTSAYAYNLYVNKNNCLDMELTLSGGFICDDVGLGKTYSTISHIMCQRANDIAHGGYLGP